jgi:septal ring factor EnvC (AmiA/AmiB activator)
MGVGVSREEFQNEIAISRLRIAQLETENVQFRLRIAQLETENVQFRLRIAQLETENLQLRNENSQLRSNLFLKATVHRLLLLYHSNSKFNCIRQ